MTEAEKLQKIDAQIEFLMGCMDWVRRKLEQYSSSGSGDGSIPGHKQKREACRERIVCLESRLKELQLERESLLRQMYGEWPGVLKIED